MNDSYTPRFSFEITVEQQKRADKLLSVYGMRKNIFSPILDDLLDLIEVNGNIIIGVLLDERVKPRDIIPVLKKAETKGAKK